MKKITSLCSSPVSSLTGFVVENFCFKISGAVMGTRTSPPFHSPCCNLNLFYIMNNIKSGVGHPTIGGHTQKSKADSYMAMNYGVKI